jgi:hypothetical protein
MKKIRLSFFLPLMALACFPSIGKTLDDIRRAFTRNTPEKIDRVWEWFEPHGGEIWVLPSEVVDGIQLLRAHGIREYSYQGEWNKRNGVEQRLLEAAYPAIPEEESKNVLQLAIPNSFPCKVIEKIGEVQLVECP